MTAPAPHNTAATVQAVLDSLPRLTASRLYRLPMRVVRGTVQEHQVLRLLMGWLDRNGIRGVPYALQVSAAFVVRLWDTTGRTSPKRLTRLAALVLGWSMADAVCGKESPHLTRHAIHLRNSFYTSDTAPQTCDWSPIT